MTTLAASLRAAAANQDRLASYVEPEPVRCSWCSEPSPERQTHGICDECAPIASEPLDRFVVEDLFSAARFLWADYERGYNEALHEVYTRARRRAHTALRLWGEDQRRAGRAGR